MITRAFDVWGGTDIRPSNPPIRVYEDVLYVPRNPVVLMDNDHGYGLYDSEGQLILEAAYRRNPTADVVGSALSNSMDRAALPRISQTLIYGGPYIPHFGHFICASLARFWALQFLGDFPILLHSGHDADGVYFYPFSRALMEAAGIAKDRLVIPTSPVRLDRVIVPAPAFEEQHCAHPAFYNLCLKMGEPFWRPATSERPAYLSRSQIPTGVSYITNEVEIEAMLEAAGVEIVHPQTLDIGEQIALFSSRRPLLGAIGSAFHTQIFTPPASRLILFNSRDSVNSNYILMDGLTKRETTYLTVDGGCDTSQRENFSLAFSVPNTRELADAFLDEIR